MIAVDRARVATIVDAPTEKAVQASFNLLSVDVPSQLPKVPGGTSDELNSFPLIGNGTIGGALVPTVSARDLHRHLGTGKDFSTWIKERIAAYAFNEHSDFEIFEDLSSPNSGSSKSRAQVTKEYALTIDMAKELGMVERTAKGKEVRAYFIECERKLREQPRASLLPDLSNEDAVLRYILEQAQGRLADRDRAAAAEAKAEEVGAVSALLP